MRERLALIIQRSEKLNFENLSLILNRDSSSISRLASKANYREDLRQLVTTFEQFLKKK